MEIRDDPVAYTGCRVIHGGHPERLESTHENRRTGHYDLRAPRPDPADLPPSGKVTAAQFAVQPPYLGRGRAQPVRLFPARPRDPVDRTDERGCRSGGHYRTIELLPANAVYRDREFVVDELFHMAEVVHARRIVLHEYLGQAHGTERA